MTSVATCIVATCMAEEVTLQISAPNAVAVGDKFRVEYVLNAQGSGFRCDLEQVAGLQVLSGPNVSTSMSQTFINGQRSSSVKTSFTFYVSATKEGTVTLPAATVSVNGKSYASGTASLKILPADEASKSNSQQQSNASSSNDARQQSTSASNANIKNDVHLDIALSKTKVYEGEAILATVKLYFRNESIVELSDAKLPDFEGFTVQEIDLPQQQATLERYQGANYQAYTLKQYLLFPQRSGKIEIPSASVKAVAQVVVSRSSGGFFDFPMAYTQNVEVPAVSAAKSVTVEALPTAGRPASFNGSVGNFTIQASLNPEQVRANEALTYRIEIEGTGNLKYLRNPEPNFPADFEVYDPKVDLATKNTATGVSGKKSIEYTIIPRYAGTFEIPALEFSFFDPKSGQYKTLTTRSFTLNVEKGAEGSGANNGAVADFSGNSQERLKLLASDVRYLHPLRSDSLKQDDAPFFGTTRYWAFFVFPFVLFLALAFAYRRQLKLNADLDMKRTRKAGKVATKRLKEAAAALKAQDESKFYEAIHKAMLGYVSDKLNIPMSELNRDTVEAQLTDHGATEEQTQRFVDVLSTCEFARYAPSKDAHAMDELYKRASGILDSLEGSLKKKI